MGIRLDNGAFLTVGDGGTITLNGTGGGSYSGTGTSNHGIGFPSSNATLTAGVAGGAGLNTINLTGIGGAGGGTNIGVYIQNSTFVVALNGTNPNNSLNFLNCVGGSGLSGNNPGVNSANTFTMVGNLTYQNCTGGTGGTGNYGVIVSNTTVVASNITAIDCMGGAGTGTDIGFYLANGSLGNSLLTKTISLQGGSLGTGSTEVGVFLQNTALTVMDGGTITLNGTGGGLYTGTGSTNHGIGSSAIVILSAGVAGGAGLNTINFTGIGGAGAGGSNQGVNLAPTTFTVSLNGTNPNNSLNFINCTGGSSAGGTTGINIGVFISRGFTMFGNLTFQNCTGGSGGNGTLANGNHGVNLNGAVTIAASNITATDCMGGIGGNGVGFYVTNVTLGNVATGRISLQGGSLGIGSGEVGIRVDTGGSIVVGDGGTINLVGTGGGLYSGTGTTNYGVSLTTSGNATLTAGVAGGSGLNTINITGMGGAGIVGSNFGVNINPTVFTVNLNGTNANNSLNFINCVGGVGLGGSNHGVKIAAGFTHQGNLTFQNCTGGSGGASNHGVFFSAGTTAASTITALDCMGGPGTGTDIGFYLSGAVVGNSVTNRISVTAGSLGAGSSEVGIQADGTSSLVVGNGGTINLNGTGGGVYSSGASTNYGISFAGTTITLTAGVAGSGGLNTINLTGLGGSGSGGSHFGVNINPTTMIVNLNGTNANNSLNFTNCLGGSGSTGSNHGVKIAAGFTHQGNLTFQNCTGGSGGASNHGVFFSAGTTAASNITATDCMGGPGTGTDIGFYLSGATVGNSVTNRISVTAGSLGLGSGEVGIQADGTSSIVVGNGGTINLNGTGGGVYASGASTNYGISFAGTTITLTAGVAGSAGLNAINLTGLGGFGSSGSHFGVNINPTTFTVNLNGTNANNSLNFLNCAGGSGLTGLNHGVKIATGFTHFGNLTFQNCMGGSRGASNHGVFFSAGTTAASTITALDCMGGPGTGTDIGFYISGATVGNSVTNRISVTAGSLGLGSGEVGIQCDGTSSIVVGNGGTITLNGTGGGVYSSGASTNYGISFAGTTITLTAGVAGSAGLNTINLTGLGGFGSGGSHFGVNINPTTFTVNLNGTNANNSLNFTNCLGGSGSTGSNHGVKIAAGFTHFGNLTFQNCNGGSGGASNHGVFFSAGTTAASTITVLDCMGGPGTGTDIGFYISGATVGNSVTNRISVTAGSLGTGSNEVGIQADGTSSIVVGDGGTISLNGTGGGVYSSGTSTNYGISFAGTTITLTAGVAGAGGLNTINLTGLGGFGSSGSHFGVNISPTTFTVNLNGTNTNNSLNFLNCLGGSGLTGLNHGVKIATGFTHFGNLTFQNCNGGSGGISNHGIFLSSVSVGAFNITATDCMGGPGTGTDIGFYVNGATLGSAATSRISLVAGSLGVGSNEVGIQCDGTSSIVVGNGGTINLNGTGGGVYSNVGVNNYGISFTGTAITLTAGVSSSALNTINLTGLGGFGSGGSHFGVNINPTTFTVNLNGTNANNSLNFINCLGGSGGQNNHGVLISTGFTHFGNLTLQNCTGGNGTTTPGNGVRVTGAITVAASNIIATDIMGGGGSGSNSYGFSIAGGAALGNTATGRISIQAGSFGGTAAAAFGQGIRMDSCSVTVGNGGTITLIGTGGGTYAGAGSANVGIRLIGPATFNAGVVGSAGLNTINITGIGGAGIQGNHDGVRVTTLTVNLNGTNANNSLNFINCLGGSGGNTNTGVRILGGFTHQGNLTFQNCTGGSGGTGMHGVFLNGAFTVAASNITATDCFAGAGTGSEAGFQITTAALGNSSTSLISIQAGSLGTGSSEAGIKVDTAGSTAVGNGGSITLNGTGGGLYSSSGSSNIGVYFSSATLTAGVAGSNGLNTINVTGVGGAGSGGAHAGVLIDTAMSVNLNGTNANNSLNFINCLGGSGGQNNHGVLISTGFTHFGLLTFQNCTGGNGTATPGNGVRLTGAFTVAASNITATDIMGGGGTGSNSYGFNIAGGAALGNTATGRISITAGSFGGTAATTLGQGIRLDSSSMTVGNGGTINLVGTGGGAYNGTGFQNRGVFLFGPATLNAGEVGSAGLNTINITGIGGAGIQGQHDGAAITTLTVNLNGTNPNNSLNFINCLGGSGGNTNTGVQIAGSFTHQGNLTFQNCTGGSGGTGMHGVFLNGAFTVAASNITSVDCMSGAGTGTDVGFYVSGSTLGNSATGRISIQGGSLGTGSSEVGIKVDTSGALVIGNGGTINLNGIGGGLYTGSGTANHGVHFNTGSITAGVSGSALNTINITGIGGAGSGATTDATGHNGVLFSGTVTINGTNANSALNFLNCLGGTGTGGFNMGAQFTGSLNVGSTATLALKNCTGGSGGGSNHGVYINNGATIAGATINAMDCMGGPGTGTNIGFYVHSGNVGSAATANNITIQAGSLGTGAGEVGIQVDGTSQIQGFGSGSISLEGIGGNGTGSANYGIYLTGSGSVPGAGAVTLIGIPGIGTTTGIYLDAGTSASATTGNLTFTTLSNDLISLVGNNSTNSASTSAGNITFNGPVNLLTNTVGVASTVSGNITFNETVNGSGIGLNANATGGTVTFVEKVGSTAALGAFHATGGTAIVLDADVTTAGATMTFTGPVQLGNEVVLTTNNANMSFSSTIDNTENLILNPGALGTISVTGAVGSITPLNALTIVNTAGATFSGSVSAASVLQEAGTSITFQDTITTNGPGGINLTASSSITFESAITITGGGSFDANGPVILSTVTTSIDTSSEGGYITFGDTVNSAAATNKALSLTAGTGPITFSGVVGGVDPLLSITVNSASDVLFSADATTASGGAIAVTHSGLLTIPSGVLLTGGGGFVEDGSGTVDLGGNITTTNSAITFNTPVVLTTLNPTLTSGNGAVTFDSGSTIRPTMTGVQGLTISAGDVAFNEEVGTPALYLGALAITNSGALTTRESADIYASSINISGGTSATFDGDLTTNTVGGITIASSTIHLDNTITTTLAGPVALTGAVVLDGPSIINTTSGGGNVTFSSTITGANDLTITSGAGTIALGGNIGTAGVPIGALTITSTGLTIPGLTLYAASAAFNAPVTLTTGGTAITASLNGDLSFSSTINGAEDLILVASGTGKITFGGDVGTGTALASLTANGPVLLTRNTTVDTNAGIIFGSTIDGDYVLTLNPTTSVALGGVVGGVIPIADLILSGTGITLSSNIYIRSPLNFTTLPITLGGDVFISTQNIQTGANITMGAVTGASNSLTLNPGSGNVLFSGVVSGVDALGIFGAANVTVNNTIGANSFTQTLGTGTTTVNSAITTTGALQINTNILTLNAALTAGGTMTLTHTGQMTIKEALQGSSFTETGGGVVDFGDLAGSITATSGTVTMNSPILLTADPTITGTDVVINNIIDGAEPLTVNATNSVTFTSAAGVGFTTPPTQLDITAETISLGANQTISGNITYTGDLLLTNTLTIDAAGTLTTTGDVTTNGKHLTAFAGADLTFESPINSSGTSGGNVTLISTGGNVTVNSIDASGTVGNGGSIILQPAFTYTTTDGKNYPDGLIRFQGTSTVNLKSTGASGLGTDRTISLSPRGREVPQSVATMVSSLSGNNVSFHCGSLVMGTNEAMTILGSIAIEASAYTALSDLVARDTITLPGTTPGCIAPDAASNYWQSNFVISRPVANLLTSTGGSAISDNVHILAGAGLTYCIDSITPNCTDPSTFAVRNIGVVATLTGDQLQYNDGMQTFILNFDSNSEPAPPPPSPSGPCNCTPSSPLPRRDYIAMLLNAGAELQDRLPPFWPSTYIEPIPKICPDWRLQECDEHILRFQTFTYANDLR
jgi:hypothetical protein